MKIEQVKKIFEEDDSLKYALATNIAKYGRPQSKKSDKKVKLTKSLEKKREKAVKDLKKSMGEQDMGSPFPGPDMNNKGYIAARKLIDQLRATTFRKFNDDELEEFRKEIANAFDMTLKEGDTYEKMAAKGKKAGNLKQGTVRKRLGIPKDKKIISIYPGSRKSETDVLFSGFPIPMRTLEYSLPINLSIDAIPL